MKKFTVVSIRALAFCLPDVTDQTFAFGTALGQILISCSEVLLLLVDRVVEIFCAVCTGYGDVDQVIWYSVGR